MSLLERVERLRTGAPADISRFVEGICPEWIEEALRVCGKASIRSRKLPAEKVLWLVVGMALFGDRSIQKVIEHLGLVVQGLIQSSAVSRARQKLGAEPLIWLFRRVAEHWGESNEKRWKGLSLYGLDGTHLRVDDSEENNCHFGRPKGRASVGYPQLRLVALMNLTSRLLTAAAVGEWHKSEVALARDLWGQIPENSLTIVDRGFLSYGFILSFLSRGTKRHFLVRLKSDSRYQLVKTLADGSAIATIVAPKSVSRTDDSLPSYLTVRLIKYQNPGGLPGLMITSLLDAAQHPAQDLIFLYHKRWELEIAFDEVKTHLLRRKEALRSRTVEGVYQEVWGLLLTYNLIRREMTSVAEAKALPSSRISFTGAFLLIQNFFLMSLTASPGTLPREIADLGHRMGRTMVLPPRRSGRRLPRQVKITLSRYKKAPGRPVSSPQKA